VTQDLSTLLIARSQEHGGWADRRCSATPTGRTFEGVAIRVAQRVLAMAAGIWHNNLIGAPVTRPLIAYDH